MPFHFTFHLLKPMIYLKIIHFLREECKKGEGVSKKVGGFQKMGITYPLSPFNKNTAVHCSYAVLLSLF